MRNFFRHAVALLALAAIAWLPACTGSDLDSGDSADVVLEVGTTTVPPVTAAPSAGGTGGCTLTVAEGTMQLLNKPKNELATGSPFNDIQLETLTIEYQWDNDVLQTLPITQNIAGVVPANGTLTITFTPIYLNDIIVPDMLGHSCNLTMTVHGRTIDGRPVSTTVRGRVLNINSTC